MTDELRSAIEIRNELKPAPGELAAVQAFVNTLDVERGRDELESPQALGSWLAARGWLSVGVELEDDDLARVLTVRKGLRSLLAGKGVTPREVREELERAMSSALLRARFPAAGGLRLEPAASGLDEALGRLLLIIFVAHRDDRLHRLKICANDTCRATFYDTTTNRSGIWCQVRCGNKYSARAFRRRERHRKHRGR